MLPPNYHPAKRLLTNFHTETGNGNGNAERQWRSTAEAYPIPRDDPSYFSSQVSPALAGIQAELPKIPQEPATTNGLATLPRTSHRKQEYAQESQALDLSDVVGDFEATLRRSNRSWKPSERHQRTENG